MGIISRLLFGVDIDWSTDSSNEAEKKKQEEKNRLKNLGLDEEEIRLVMEEDWDETSFEEESDEIEDDDYYNEDDFYNDNYESDDEEDEDDEWV